VIFLNGTLVRKGNSNARGARPMRRGILCHFAYAQDFPCCRLDRGGCIGVVHVDVECDYVAQQDARTMAGIGALATGRERERPATHRSPDTSSPAFIATGL
jgi:hypothetical protein